MKSIQFDIYGRMAHFRKFFSTVTSLSYYFPPRNTVTGLLAAILGLERDSYYDLFSDGQLGIAVQILREPRKQLVSVDYLDVEQSGKKFLDSLRGQKGRKPTKIEFIFPMDGDEIGYRIFLVAKNQDIENKLSELYSNIKESRFLYPVSLGPAYCLASIEPESLLSKDIELIKPRENETYRINTVIPVDKVKIETKMVQGKKVFFEEALPPNFTIGRNPEGGSRNYIFEAKGNYLDVYVKSEIFKIDGDVYGIFI